MGKLRALILSPLLVCFSLLIVNAQTTLQAGTPGRYKDREEIKAKGIALLAEIETTIQEIKSPYSRIQAQIKVAEFLWEVDEKRAAKFMSNAVSGMKEFLAMADVSSEQEVVQYHWILQLRNELIRVLAERDPDAALNFLYSTTPRYRPYSSSRELLSQESALELSIANQIAQKDPNRAMQIARRSLKQGYPFDLVATVSQIARKNPELAKELVHEMAGKLLAEEKLIKNSGAANLASSLLRSFHTPEESVQITVGEMVLPFHSGLLSEDEYKQLLQKAMSEIISYTPRDYNNHSSEGIWVLISGLQSLGAELDRAISGGKAAVEKKSKELSDANPMHFNPGQEYQDAIGSNPVEAALETIERVPADYQEQLYIQLANREVTNSNAASARQIVNDHVTNPYQRRQVLASIEHQEMYQALGKGKVEEALRMIGNLRPPKVRAAVLSNVLNQLGARQTRATALSLLEQARALLSPSHPALDAEHMNALFHLASAFAQYDAKRSFEIVDPLIDQFNEICAAARTLEGFGGEYFEDDELNLKNGNGLANIASQMSAVLGDLALIDFDRAKATSEKIRLPEIRLKVYLAIAQQTIKGGR